MDREEQRNSSNGLGIAQTQLLELLEGFARILLAAKRDVSRCSLQQEIRLDWQWLAGELHLVKGLSILLCVQFHASEIVVCKGIIRREFHSVPQRFASRTKLTFGPAQK